MAFFQLHKEQKINASIDQVWNFISAPANLKEITPPYMGFEIQSKNKDASMYQGMIICYKVSPLMGIKTTWVTEITHVKEKAYFVDEQRVGPYKLWHHQHIIEPVKNGVLMRDIVSYAPPFGLLGRLANSLIIKHKLKEIFEYRTRAVENKFGKYQEPKI